VAASSTVESGTAVMAANVLTTQMTAQNKVFYAQGVLVREDKRFLENVPADDG
jgi:hypothetical protein